MKFAVTYRDGEITAEVEAKDEGDAIQKFLAGEVVDVEVSYSSLWPDMCLAEPLD